jgi:hypothetical protein
MTQQAKKAVRFIARSAAQGCLNREGIWQCCQAEFTSIAEIYAHLNSIHAARIDELSHLANLSFIEPREVSQLIKGTLNIDELSFTLEERRLKTERQEKFSRRRLEKGKSDKFIIECDCNSKGTVLLFYRYVAVSDCLDEADRQMNLCSELDLRGKIRIADEGFNITVGGSSDSIQLYLDYMAQHPLFVDLDLGSDLAKRKAFFKPSPGCKHGMYITLNHL